MISDRAEDTTVEAAGPTAASAFLRFDLLEEVVACAALVVIVAAVAWGVLTRYITVQPAAWTGEIAGTAFAWLVFAGAAAGFKHGAHVSIDLVTSRLPVQPRQMLVILVDIAILAFALYVARLGAEFTTENWDNPSSVLRWPLSIVYASVTFGFASIALRQAFRLGRQVLGAARR